MTLTSAKMLFRVLPKRFPLLLQQSRETMIINNQWKVSKGALFGVALLASTLSVGQSNSKPLSLAPPSQVQRVTDQMGIDQKLGDVVPLDLKFRDENGKLVLLSDFYGKRPVVILPIFYNCKTACSNLLMSMLKTLAKASKLDALKVGREFDVVAISLHPKETPDLALSKKAWILETFEPPNKKREEWAPLVQQGWHFLIGEGDSVRKLTNAVGFKYGYDPVKDMINHPVCTIMTTPNGVISSYTIGINYTTKELEQNLALAEKGKVSEKKADQSSMFGCIMIDPVTGARSLVIEQIVKLAGILTVAILGLSIFIMSRRSRPFDPSSGGSVRL